MCTEINPINSKVEITNFSIRKLTAEDIKYSNTYNVFKKMFGNNKSNMDSLNSLLNERSKKAHTKGEKIHTDTPIPGLREEIVFYDNNIYCFIMLDFYIVLYNYWSPEDIGINNQLDLINLFHSDKASILNTLRFISTGFQIGHVCFCEPDGMESHPMVINTYESFLEYTDKKGLPRYSDSNKPFFESFKENLSISCTKSNSFDDLCGIRTYDSNSLNSFTYIYFSNIMIITSYTDSFYPITIEEVKE